MWFRRSCLVVLVAGSAVVGRAGCSHPINAPVTVRTQGGDALRRSDPPTACNRGRGCDLRPRPHHVPDERGALQALSHAVTVLFSPTTLPAPPAAVGPQPTAVYPASFQPCGGAYPPCWRVATESGGDYGAYNPTGCGGSGCFGKWQFSGEWAGKLGLPLDLRLATSAQQDEAARILWDGGAGCSNWSAC